MKQKLILYLLTVTVLVPVTLFYVWGVYVFTAIQFNYESATFPLLLILPGSGLISLWVITVKYEKYAASKIPIIIIVGLVAGAVFSIYAINGVENLAILYMYGSPIFLLIAILAAIYRIRKQSCLTSDCGVNPPQ